VSGFSIKIRSADNVPKNSASLPALRKSKYSLSKFRDKPSRNVINSHEASEDIISRDVFSPSETQQHFPKGGAAR